MDETIIVFALEHYRANGTWPGKNTLRKKFGIGDYRAIRLLEEAKARAAAEEAGRKGGEANLPHPRVPTMDDWPRLEAGVLVLGDFHIPAHDPDWIERAAEEARREGVEHLLIAGDLVDFGMVSRFPSEAKHTLEDELDDAHELLRWFRSVFPGRIDIIPGNHDDRLAKKLDRQLTTQFILEVGAVRQLPGVETHWHHQAWVGRHWLVAHPASYSRHAPNVARELAAIYQANVAMAHDHLVATGLDISGRWWAVSFGACADPRRLFYKQRELKRYPALQQGGLIIYPDESFRLLSPRLTSSS